jgi:hypothetical protein
MHETCCEIRIQSYKRKNYRYKHKRVACRLQRLQAGLAVVSLAVTVSACSIVSGVAPKDYPLPIYPGAGMQIDGYHELLGTRSLILKTRDSSSSAHQFYVNKLKESGWQIINDKKIDETYLIDAARNKEAANVTIQADVIILTWIKHRIDHDRHGEETGPRSAAVGTQPAI